MQTIKMHIGGRARRLYRAKNGSWQIRFKINGRQFWRSLGTTIEAVAKEKAKQIVEAELKGDKATSSALKVKSDFPSLRQLCDIFIARFSKGAVKEDERWIGGDRRRCATARNYVSALGVLVREAIGRTLEEARANVLTDELVEKFERAYAERITRDARGFINKRSELSVRTSIQSIIGQARSIFKKSSLNWYRDFNMPDLTNFMRQGFERPRRMGAERLPEGAIAAIAAAAPKLALTNPRLYIAHLLFKHLGMRNSEICAARKSWIALTPEFAPRGIAAQLDVKERPDEDFYTKAGERMIPMTADVLAEIEKYWMGSPDGDYLVPAANKTERFNIVNREHNDWCRAWITDRGKVSYELRRYAGYQIWLKTLDIRKVQYFLGHTDPETTRIWYLPYIPQEVPGLSLADFAAPAPAEPAPGKVVQFS
jgi:integrase